MFLYFSFQKLLNTHFSIGDHEQGGFDLRTTAFDLRKGHEISRSEFTSAVVWRHGVVYFSCPNRHGGAFDIPR